MTGKRVNRSVALGLKISVSVDARDTTWVKNSLEKLDNELYVKVKKCDN